ncbi:MAG: AAA domain-containing protein [Bacteroidota bacterium]
MKELFTQLAEALQKELEQLKATRREIRLFSGERIGAFAGYTYYRFEIPEDIILRTTERATFTFGQQQPISVTGNIIAIENQFFIVALPQDFGTSLPETKCSWNYEDEHKPIIDLLQRLDVKSPIPQVLFDPADRKNSHIVNFETSGVANTPPEQLETVKKILQNRVTMVWGPILSGKTHVLALTALCYIKAGRKVLFVAPSNDNVDSMLLNTVRFGEQLGIKMTKFAARVDLPSPGVFDTIAQYSFEHQVETAKAEKRKVFQERVALLNTYWQIKIKQILHEDFYHRVQEKRDRLAELRKQIEQASDEITQLNQVIVELENSSLIERMKKGFSKNDLEHAHEQLARQQQNYKRFLSIQQTISNEITSIELDAPITPREQMEFRETGKRIDDLGGLEKVTKTVEDFISVDEQALLRSKLFIATGISAALIDPAIRNQQFDLVIVDEAQRVNLPTLAALSTLAREKFVVAGDPFQVEPESVSMDEQSEYWLQRDIFLHVAHTTELHRLFEWADRNPRWSIFMKSHYATTPKLSLFIASVLFDEKINVHTSPKAKGRIYFFDTSKVQSRCKQYAGKKKILPYNELHTRQVIECVKHALMEPNRFALDVGVVLPFTGPTLYTKLQLRLQGIKNVEVGTPQSFCNRRKDAIIFDTTMAGVDYTMRSIDDKKIGEHKIARLFNTVFSCVGEDLYVIADMAHFRSLYQDRLFTRLLMLLQTQADEQQLSCSSAVKKFDDLDRKQQEELYALYRNKSQTVIPAAVLDAPKEKVDHELEIQMKMMAKQWESKLAANTGSDKEREVFTAVQRVFGWRTDVNLVSQFVGGDLIFRNSFTTEEILRKLPLDICENENHFRDVMEKWNLLIYEMSGGQNTDLSFFASKGPEARVRQDIRNLRAYYSSDVEAVIEEGKKKIAVEVARVFQELLGKNRPDNPIEWSTAYLNFLKRLEAYLSWTSEQVRR